MARRGYDEYERDMGDRRSLDPRETQRERYSREVQDPNRVEYTRDSRSDQRLDRDSASRPPYSYSSTDNIDRNDLHSRRYTDDSQDIHRPPIGLNPEMREEVSSPYHDYFLPGEGINRQVIQYDICRYLGADATVRPYTLSDGRQGYVIKAYRAPTTAMIIALKQDSIRFENEQAARQQSTQPITAYLSSALFDDRQRQGRPDLSGQSYAGDDVTMDFDDYDGFARDDRGPQPRTHLATDSRTVLRMDPRMDSRMDSLSSARDLRASRMDQDIYGSIGSNRSREYYSIDPRANPRLPLPRVSDSVYGAGYPMATSGASYAMATSGAGYPMATSGAGYHPMAPSGAGYHPMAPSGAGYPVATSGAGYDPMAPSGAYPFSTTATSRSASTYADSTTGRLNVEYQAGARHPGWGDTPNFRERWPGV